MLNQKQQSGFTIVELLIVVVVIAILAAITIVAYNGISQRAISASLQSDLSGAAATLENDRTLSTDSSYPTTLAAANGGKGIKFGNGAGSQYTVDNTVNPSAFCITAAVNTISYYVDQTGTVRSGYCPGQVAPADNTAIVTTFAGSDTAGQVDATGTNAQFSGLYGIAIDASGVLYIADSDNNVIRKVTTSGVASTIAGSGAAGFADGTGTAAQFNAPRGIAVDSSGNLYVADYYNNRIRKITSGGVVSTLAGAAVQGTTDGAGASARFYYPRGVAIDTSGNLFVADTTNNRIRKITSGGTVSTLAGSSVGYNDATGTAAQFNDPRAIALDGSGNLYVTDTFNNMIRKVTAAGVVTTLAGSTTAGTKDGTGTSAQFSEPTGITLGSDGALYVADATNDRIRKITTSGVVTTIAGSARSFADGTGTNALFNKPRGIVSAGNKTFYVADTANNRIRKIQLP